MSDSSISQDRRYHRLLCICVLIFLSAMLFRLLKLVLDPALMRDSTLYLMWAERWFDTGNYYFELFGVQIKTAVLPIWMIKVLMSSGFSAEVAGRALSIFLGSMIPVLGFFVALDVCGKVRIALLTALLLVIHPDLVTYSIQPLRDNLYMFSEAFLLLAIIASVKHDSLFSWSICGLFTAMHSFCRYEGLEFFIIVSFVIIALHYFRKDGWKHAFRNIAVFSAVFGIVSLLLLSLSNYDIGIFTKIRDLIRINTGA